MYLDVSALAILNNVSPSAVGAAHLGKIEPAQGGNNPTVINSIVDIMASCMDTMMIVLGDNRPGSASQMMSRVHSQFIKCTPDNSQTFTAVFALSLRQARGPKPLALIQRLKILENPEVFDIIALAFFRQLRFF